MALRLIEMVVPETDGRKARELLKEHKLLEFREIRLSDKEVLIRILLDAEQTEAVLDSLEEHRTGNESDRMVILPVEATLPRAEQKEPVPSQRSSERISREELYEDIKDAARCSWVYLVMVVLSTIVAAVGLYNNSVTFIIGAMVIAPMLGPSMASALGTTLGDVSLLRRAFLTNLAGIAITITLATSIGMLVPVDPTGAEVVARTRVGAGDVAVALASGCAGALAFARGASAIVIGVMVAVALLPPLVNLGLLLGRGDHLPLVMGALSLFLINLCCVNLSGVITFLVQGIHPTDWWEKGRATKATRLAIGLWVALLAALIGLILLLRKSGM